MAFNRQYNSLEDVLSHYGLSYQEEPFVPVTDFTLSISFKEDLAFVMSKLDYRSSESAIRQYIISPILKEAWKRYADDFLLWIEKPIRFDDELSGVPDYMISRRSKRGKIFFESPHIAVVEAKKDDFTNGWAQCALEMVAIQKINHDENLTVFGIVTNGDTWEFAQLKQTVFHKFESTISLSQLDMVYNVLCSILERCR